MLTLRDIDSLIQFDKLDKSHKEDLSFVFKTYGKKVIIIYPDGGLLTYKRFLNHSVPSYDSVSFDVHMFINAYSLYKNTDIVGIKDNSGKLIGVITDALSSYFHPYQNDGGLDMWFLNQYDCIFLHGVNEGSLLLVCEALHFWNGKRLVLVGKFWNDIVDSLPDIKGIDCFLEENEDMGNEYLDQYSNGYHCLHIIEGIPHLEDPKRFNLGISYYDEVLSFTYMFSEMHSYGEENPDHHFCIIDMPYNNLGLFGLRDKAICVARYVKACGYIPVLNMAHFYKGSYKNNSSDDMWTLFFNQPEKYSLEDIKNSKYVHHVPYFYNGNVQSLIMENRNTEIKLSFSDGLYNQRVTDTLGHDIPHFLPHPNETLGILARGTDYVKAKYVNHAVHATPEQICTKIDETLKQHPEYKYLYLSTEDRDYCQYFSNRYKGKITFTDQKRYSVHEGESLMQMHERETDKRDAFDLGMEYILSIECLGRCRGLVASGLCAGVTEALRINDGNYLTTYVFQKGVN